MTADMIRDILRMGDPRLLERAKEVERFGTPELAALLADMRDTMAALDGAGLAAPQIGVPLRVVIFGLEYNPRYPDAEPVPYTELVNPVLTPLADEQEDGWEGCLSVPGIRGVVPRYTQLRYEGFDPRRPADRARRRRLPRARASSTNATIWTASCIRCASSTCASSASPTCCFRSWPASTTTIDAPAAPRPRVQRAGG